jgi:hypothetical protein
MDANTRDVLVVSITVLGTLGGIVVGAWLQGRHRFDDKKRRVYSRIIGLVRETTWALGRLPGYGPIPDGLYDAYVDQVGDLVSITQLLGGKAVIAAAEEVPNASTARSGRGSRRPRIARLNPPTPRRLSAGSIGTAGGPRPTSIAGYDPIATGG